MFGTSFAGKGMDCSAWKRLLLRTCRAAGYCRETRPETASFQTPRCTAEQLSKNLKRRRVPLGNLNVSGLVFAQVCRGLEAVGSLKSSQRKKSTATSHGVITDHMAVHEGHMHGTAKVGSMYCQVPKGGSKEHWALQPIIQ